MATAHQLSHTRIVALNNAIHSLEGRVEVAKDNDGKVLGLVTVPYDLDLKARYACARTLTSIQPVLTAYEKARKDKVKASNDGKLLEKDQKLSQECQDQLQELENTETAVELYTCDAALFKFDTNKISPSIIAALIPMLRGFDIE